MLLACQQQRLLDFSSLYNFNTKQGLKFFTTTNALGGLIAFLTLAALTMAGVVQ